MSLAEGGNDCGGQAMGGGCPELSDNVLGKKVFTQEEKGDRRRKE